MTRIVKEPVVRRNEILDAAEQLIATKGYEQMSIRDIVDELQIAKGTVYHYFDSKQALLLALVERRSAEAEQFVLPLIHDPAIGALEKLRRFFAILDQHKRANRPLVLAFTRVWYAPENAITHHALANEGRKRLVPWLSEIIRQGIAEGIFTTSYPDQTARMIFALLEDLGSAIAEVIQEEDLTLPNAPHMLQVIDATADALERMLGIQPGDLQQAWREDVARWQALPPNKKNEYYNGARKR